MIKFMVLAVFLGSCVVSGQPGHFHGFSSPTCGATGNYCIEGRDCCSKSCTASKCTGEVTTTVRTVPLDNRFGGEGGDCTRIGNYCRANNECCSGDCFVVERRCRPGRNQPPIANSINPGSGIINRFGEPTTFQVNQPSNSPAGQGQQEQTFCSQERQQCSNIRPCCAFLSCQQNICRDVAVHISGTETFGHDKNNENGLINRFGEETATTTQVPPVNVNCFGVGGKCYKQSDCCPGLRCHGFAHQCVT